MYDEKNLTECAWQKGINVKKVKNQYGLTANQIDFGIKGTHLRVYSSV